MEQGFEAVVDLNICISSGDEMDCDWFVRQHKELDFKSYEEELDFAVAQHAWKKIYGDESVNVLEIQHESVKRTAMLSLELESARMKKDFDNIPEKSFPTDDRNDGKIQTAKDQLLNHGIDKSIVDYLATDYGKLKGFQLQHVRPEVAEHAIKEWMKEVDRTEICDNLALNRFLSGRDLNPKSIDAYFQWSEFSAQDRARIECFGRRPYLLSELKENALDDVLSRYSKEVQRFDAEVNEYKATFPEHEAANCWEDVAVQREIAAHEGSGNRWDVDNTYDCPTRAEVMQLMFGKDREQADNGPRAEADFAAVVFGAASSDDKEFGTEMSWGASCRELWSQERNIVREEERGR